MKSLGHTTQSLGHTSSSCCYCSSCSKWSELEVLLQMMLRILVVLRISVLGCWVLSLTHPSLVHWPALQHCSFRGGAGYVGEV